MGLMRIKEHGVLDRTKIYTSVSELNFAYGVNNQLSLLIQN